MFIHPFSLSIYAKGCYRTAVPGGHCCAGPDAVPFVIVLQAPRDRAAHTRAGYHNTYDQVYLIPSL